MLQRLIICSVIAICAGLFGYWYKLFEDGEITSKREWSYVQAALGQDSDEDIEAIRFFQEDGFEVVGIRSAPNSRRVWILAKARAEERLKTMAKFARNEEMPRVRITRGEFDRIKQTVALSRDVETFLLNAITP